MNRFYELPGFTKWSLSIFFSVIAAAILYLMLIVSSNVLVLILLVILFIPLLQALSTPLMALMKVYKYYSDLLIVYNPNQNNYNIHGGTGFDYFFFLSRKDFGLTARKKILRSYLEGLYNIILDIEKGVIPDTVRVYGTSYFFSRATAERFGFTVTKPDFFTRFNLFFNFLEFLWMHSFARGRLKIPNVLKVKKAEIEGKDLVEQKDHIKRVIKKLNPS